MRNGEDRNMLSNRGGFFNPFLFRGACGDSSRLPKNESMRYNGYRPTYYTDLAEFKFIAPRCLDENLHPDQRKGMHIGTLSRQPKVYREGQEYNIFDFNDSTELPWPRRIYTWEQKSLLPPNFDFRFDRFHVYDIIENIEIATGDDSSRFANFIRPNGSVITLLGLSACGKRVAVHVYGVNPYFYMDKDLVDRVCNISNNQQLVSLMVESIKNSYINNGVGGRHSGDRGLNMKISQECFKIDVVYATNIYFFHSRPKLYYKITTGSSRLCGYICDNFHPEITKYEGNVDVISRFILDNAGFITFGWYRLRPGANGERVQLRSIDKYVTSSDVEINCTVDNLEALPNDDTWPDYKLLCFDIECKAGTGTELAFPVATNQDDVVIQISCLIYSLATRKHELTLLFSLGSCDLPDSCLLGSTERGEPTPIILEFDSEFEMLIAFLTFIKQYSPEFATGYNIVNFDWAYIIEKLKSVYNIRLDGYGKFNRGGLFKVWDMGRVNFQKRSKVKINGLVTLDMYTVATEKLRLSSYKLNAVAEEALGEYKIDLPYKEIPRYYASGARQRGIIGEYCIQDSLLVGKLFFKYLPHLELSAIAKLANITLTRAIFDGQQIRVYTCLLKLARDRNFILPDNRNRFCGDPNIPSEDIENINTCDSMEGDYTEEFDQQSSTVAECVAPTPSQATSRSVGYQGAKVLDPISGFHIDPVVVLDFASLYPSIIQAHNLCFTTLTTERQSLETLRPGIDFSEFDVGGHKLYFVHSHVRESLLGVLLRDWLAMRKAIRARIPDSTSDEAILLDKQQAAIKVVCNSVYGFTGVANGLLPCLQIAATVTTIGRDMLLNTKHYVESRWATREGVESDFPEAMTVTIPDKPYNVQVIYGDTDSVFIKFRGFTYDGVTRLGDLMAKQISQALFRAPIKLECEKTFCKLLLITKKKYIGVINGGKMLIKGVDLVRKNNCNFINTYARRLVDILLYNDTVSEAAAEIASVHPREWMGRALPANFWEFGRVLAEAYTHITAPDLDVNDFVMTAELSRPPDAYINKRIAHLTVYYKLVMRNEEVPSVKERIPYVIISPAQVSDSDLLGVDGLRGTIINKALNNTKKRKLLVSDLAEDPSYVIANGIHLNTEYYFSHLLSTISVTFKALFGNDVKTTEILLKRFIPETSIVDRRIQTKLSEYGFEALIETSGVEETRRILNKVFCIPRATLHQS
ncbi:DNA polymerase catalytic subunit [Felid alphaherpesvirus 1]|nr:DNA polymerase catalytic subunit [Felid alphaherpesvirus 1]ALJ85352.1 DNA polymerase catalytic subunit [Felid alphaherpesvirus 1]